MVTPPEPNSGAITDRIMYSECRKLTEFPPTKSGITEASTTRNRSVPRTRNSPSTTARSSLSVPVTALAVCHHSSPRTEGRAPENQVRIGLVWGFSCQAVVLGCADSFLFGAGKAVFRPVACNQVPGARGRGQGTETLAELGGLPLSVACVSQRLDA